MYFYVNVHIWDWEISVFAQMHKPKLGASFLFTAHMVVQQMYLWYSLVRAFFLTSWSGGQGVGVRGGGQPGLQRGRGAEGEPYDLRRAHCVIVFGLTQF